jgi:ribosomal protein L11 methyltransferase
VATAMADEAAGILIANGALGCEAAKVTGSRRARRQIADGARASTPQRLYNVNGTVILRAWFDRISPRRIARLRMMLDGAGMLLNATPQVQQVHDPGWATMWQERFAPLRLGRSLLIVPPWRRERELGRTQIIIRPGQGFGTGHHPSTAGTLGAIEEILTTNQFDRALDVGTGSGILAIAMAKLGVPEVTAIDIDAAALANGVENARLNRVGRRILFSTEPLSKLRKRFGLITANILSSTLIRLAPELKAKLRARGYLVLAGILRREAEAVTAAYVPGLSYAGAHNRGAWTALIFRADEKQDGTG